LFQSAKPGFKEIGIIDRLVASNKKAITGGK
jgi:hypothetical protein